MSAVLNYAAHLTTVEMARAASFARQNVGAVISMRLDAPKDSPIKTCWLDATVSGQPAKATVIYSTIAERTSAFTVHSWYAWNYACEQQRCAMLVSLARRVAISAGCSLGA